MSDVTKLIDDLGAVAQGSIKNLGAEIKRLTNERDYWKEEAWEARRESLQHKCLSDTEAFMRFTRAIDAEISAAIRSNEAVIRERVEKGGADRLTDPICCACAGKVAALDGIWDFIEDLVKQLTEGGEKRGA